MNKLATAIIQRFTAPLSALGLITGALFWLAALTPSLIPRDGLLQGAIGGLCSGNCCTAGQCQAGQGRSAAAPVRGHATPAAWHPAQARHHLASCATPMMTAVEQL